MKKILILIGLFISANVYAQPKQIYVGGDVLTVSGDTLYKNGVFLAELGGGSIDTTGQFVTGLQNDTDTSFTWFKGGVPYTITVRGMGGGTLQSVLDAGDSSNRGLYINGMRLNSYGDNDISLGLNAGHVSAPNIAIGELAAAGAGEDQCIAIGDSAGFTTLISNMFIAIGHGAGINSNGQESMIIGNGAGRNSQGDYNVIIGRELGANLTGNNNTIIGQEGGNDITGNKNFSYSNQYIDGKINGDDNITFNSIFVNGNNNISFNGDTLTGNDNIGMGNNSLRNSQGDYNVGIGWQAGDSINSDYNVALGYRALSYNNKDGGVGIGIDAGYRNTGENLVAIGINAGANNTYDNVIALGRLASADSSSQFVLSNSVNSIRISMANITANRKYYLPNKTGTIALLDDITGGGSDNFPTVDDTLTGNRFLFSDTYNLLFSHASGNAFTLSNTGLSYDIGGNNAISMNSSYNEFKTGNISTYGMLKTTNNTARLYATDGTNTSTVVAHPKYVELDGKDSTVIKNIDEVAIDTATQHVAVLQGNQLKKVKYNVLKADSTLTITGDSISVNLPKALGYREYVASLVQTGTNAPVATVLFSNLPDSVVWDYRDVGEYQALYYNGGSPISISGSKVVVSMTNNVFYSPTLTAPVYIEAIHSATVYVFTRFMADANPKNGILGELNTGYSSQTNIITIRIYE